ncbi:hypothetical protein L1887_34183 [Cichorium endivia]|nr:hypothetical protein L1887_34183 [Cichorium endivia]
MWVVRVTEEDDTAMNAYDDINKLFTVKLHYGGSFQMTPSLQYCNGNIRYVDNVDVTRLNHDEMLSILRVLCCDIHQPVYIHYLLPGISLEKGLIPLDCLADYKALEQYVVIVGEISFFVEHGVSKVNNHGKSPIPNYLAEDGFLISPELRRIQKTPSLRASCSRQLTFDLNEPFQGDKVQRNLGGPSLEMVLYELRPRAGEALNVVHLDKPLWEVDSLNAFQADFYDPIFSFNLDDARYQWEVSTNPFPNLSVLTDNVWYDSMRQTNENLEETNTFVTQLTEEHAARSNSGPDNDSEDRSSVHLEEEDRLADDGEDNEVISSVMDSPVQEEAGACIEDDEMLVINSDQFNCYDPNISEREKFLNSMDIEVDHADESNNEVDFKVSE